MMDPETKVKWTAALRSGDFEQGRQLLRNQANEYCCLGVLAEINGVESVYVPYNPKGCVDPVPGIRGRYRYLFGNGINGASVSTVPDGYCGLTENEIGALVALNDEKRASFEDIADWIEGNL